MCVCVSDRKEVGLVHNVFVVMCHSFASGRRRGGGGGEAGSRG